jgi:hypothetical protein
MNIYHHGPALVCAAALLTGVTRAHADPPSAGTPPSAAPPPPYALVATPPPEPPPVDGQLRSRALLTGGVFVSLLGVGSIAAGAWFFNNKTEARMGSAAQTSGAVFIANGLALVGGGIAMVAIGGRALTATSVSLPIRPVVSIGPASGGFGLSF